MRPAWLLIAVASLGLVGCTSVRLRQRTMHQAATLPELQYQQVLDNLAMFAGNPAALPWHVNLREGTSQVTDSGSAGALVDLGPPAVTQPQVFGSRTIVAQWGMSPVIDPTELRLLRLAYRRALGSPEGLSPEFAEELGEELKDQFGSNVDLQQESELFYEYQWKEHPDARAFDANVVSTNDDGAGLGPGPYGREPTPLARNLRRKVGRIQRELDAIGPGWFHVGGKRDVPRDACYVGRCGDRYVWVCEDGREALTEFTLTVLKFSSLIKETQTLINPGSVKFSPGDRGG